MKKTSHCILFVLVASLFSGCATVSSRNDVIESIHSVIPAGWDAIDRGDGIWIIREKPVQMVSFFSALGGSNKAHPKRYKIVLSDADYIPPSDFAAINGRNEQLKVLVENLRKKAFAIPHDTDVPRDPRGWEFHPRTEAEEDTIAQWRSTSQQIKGLPDLYQGHCAFRMDIGFMMDSLTIEAEEKECLEVLKTVLSLFSNYGKESNK